MKKKEKISILQDMIRIQSVNDNEKDIAKYLQTLLNNYGIDSELIPWNDSTTRSNLVATVKKGEGKVLGISGHLDVVKAGDKSDWSYPPYDAHIEDNKMYGRGTTDMKAGVAALVIALIEIEKEEIPFEGTIKLLLTVGEEVGELGAKQLTDLGYADDLDTLLIAEPSSYSITYAHKGSMNYTVKAYGKLAHSSMPAEGINAINDLNLLSDRLNEAMDTVTDTYTNEILGDFTHSITVISGGTQVNSIPDQATIQGNIRSIPEFSNDRVVELLDRVIAEVNQEIEGELELTLDFNKQPVESKPDSQFIEVIQDQFDEKLPLKGLSATTDAAEFTKAENAFDVVIFGPGEPSLPHQVNEFVKIDDYLNFIDLYKKIYPQYLSKNSE